MFDVGNLKFSALVAIILKCSGFEFGAKIVFFVFQVRRVSLRARLDDFQDWGDIHSAKPSVLRIVGGCQKFERFSGEFESLDEGIAFRISPEYQLNMLRIPGRFLWIH